MFYIQSYSMNSQKALNIDSVLWVTVYLDDIFIYSHSIEEHEKHLGIVCQQLRDHPLFLSKSKVELYSKRLECLGHIIDDRGIHADANKMQCIREWRCPRTFNDVQCFPGLVQYLANLCCLCLALRKGFFFFTTALNECFLRTLLTVSE